MAVYKAIETVVASAILMWNRVLLVGKKKKNDRLPFAFRTYGPLIGRQGPAVLVRRCRQVTARVV